MLPLAALRSPALPPSLSSLLFESHWPYWLPLLALAALLHFRGRSTNSKPLSAASLITALTTFVWILLAFTFDTPPERLYAAHTQMAKAAQAGDIDTLLSFLADDFSCPQLNIPSSSAAREQLSARLKGLDIHATKITAYSVVLSPEQSSATVHASFLTDAAGQSTPTTWRLDWSDIPHDNWKIHEATLEKIGPVDLPPNFQIPTSKEGLLGM